MLSGTIITIVQHSSSLLPMREPKIFHPRADLQSCSRFCHLIYLELQLPLSLPKMGRHVQTEITAQICDWLMGWHQTLFREKMHDFAATGPRPQIQITDGWTWGECKRTNMWMCSFSMGQSYECSLASHCVRGMVVIHYRPVRETGMVGKIQFLKVQNVFMLVSMWLFLCTAWQQTSQSLYFLLYLHFLFKWLSTLQERESG